MKKEENANVLAVVKNAITSEKKDEMIKQLSKFKDEVEVTASYFDPEMGEITTCWFVGVTKMKSIEEEDKFVDAVKLLMEDGSYTVNASTVLVGTLKDLIDPECGQLECPLPVKLIKTEEKRSASKFKYFDWKVFLLS